MTVTSVGYILVVKISEIEILMEESLLEVGLVLPCLLNSWQVAAYFRYSIIWFESMIMSGRRPESIASEAHD